MRASRDQLARRDCARPQPSSPGRAAMTRRVVCLPTEGRPLLDVFSFGRPGASGRFTPAQIEQIRRTVGRVPEVIVKVTGGATRLAPSPTWPTSLARASYPLRLTRASAPPAEKPRKALLNDWHLELTAGQYCTHRDGRPSARHTKLVHNIVLSMPRGGAATPY
jgi:hypothetical protein